MNIIETLLKENPAKITQLSIISIQANATIEA